MTQFVQIVEVPFSLHIMSQYGAKDVRSRGDYVVEQGSAIPESDSDVRVLYNPLLDLHLSVIEHGCHGYLAVLAEKLVTAAEPLDVAPIFRIEDEHDRHEGQEDLQEFLCCL